MNWISDLGLIIRYVKFIQSLTRSPKMCVQFLLQKVIRKVNTITGKNVDFIHRKTGYIHDVLTVKPAVLKQKMKFCELKPEDKWRADFICEMTNIKQNVVTLDGEGFTSDELNKLIEFISTT